MTRFDINRYDAKAIPRLAIAIMAARGRSADALAFADTKCHGEWADSSDLKKMLRHASNTSQMDRITRGVADPMDTSDLGLDAYNVASAAYMETVTEESLIGKLDQAKRTAFLSNLAFPVLAAGAHWVGQGENKPVSRLAWGDLMKLEPRKVEVTVVASAEAVRQGGAQTETAIDNALREATRKKLDATFAGSDADVSDESPAGIGYTTPSFASTGATATAMRADLATAVGMLSDASVSLRTAVWIMRPEAASAFVVNGVATDDVLSIDGGRLAGIRAITSADVPAGVIRLLATEYVIIGGANTMRLNAADQTTILMDDGEEGGSPGQYSLWQRNSTALRVEIPVSWRLVGPSNTSYDSLAVASITGATYA